MKKLFEQSRQGYSFHTTHRYYLCDSIEEYNQLYEKEKMNDTTWHRVYREDKIIENPQCLNLDGFQVYGGKKFEATGFTVHWVSGCQTDYSSFDHYIKPGSIEKNETVETETGWV